MISTDQDPRPGKRVRAVPEGVLGSSRCITTWWSIRGWRSCCPIRIGTALVNGNWFVRRLKPLAHRIVLMHGHRHIDWIGECGGMPIISAPSPVMEATDEMQTYFYIHSFAVGEDGRSSCCARSGSTWRASRGQ
jgi:hypothetical protein